MWKKVNRRWCGNLRCSGNNTIHIETTPRGYPAICMGGKDTDTSRCVVPSSFSQSSKLIVHDSLCSATKSRISIETLRKGEGTFGVGMFINAMWYTKWNELVGICRLRPPCLLSLAPLVYSNLLWRGGKQRYNRIVAWRYNRMVRK